MLELSYVFHDCFVLTTKDYLLVFDYWKIPGKDIDYIPDFVTSAPADLPIYVFVSHFHKDHFNKNIFSWIKIHPLIYFILSKDTARHVRYILKPDSRYSGVRPDENSVKVIRKFEKYEDENICATAFGSTDIGNSYTIRLKKENKIIFHAGDLNCWVWRDESSPAEIKKAEDDFKKEMLPIAEAFPKIDIAMFPVDNRIGSGYGEGAKMFLSEIEVKHFFPMHFELGDNQEERELRHQGALKTSEYAGGNGDFIVLTNYGDCYRSNS